ncbi:CoA-transferase [Siccirubricoccus deserti]
MSSTETKGWDRQQMADRLAREFQDGWIVNLGVGIPTLCSNTDIGDRDILYHAENGVIGYGPVLPAGQEDLHLVNAGGQNVSLNPGAAIVHHADSFGIIRSGRIDVTVMGAYEVSAGGDFANGRWAVPRAAASAAPWTSRPAPGGCSSSLSTTPGRASRGCYGTAPCR